MVLRITRLAWRLCVRLVATRVATLVAPLFLMPYPAVERLSTIENVKRSAG